MRKMFLSVVAAAALVGVPHLAAAQTEPGGYSGGYDIGPLGQCFNPPDCGRHEDINGYYGRRSYAQGCPIVRERVVTPSGHVTYRRRRICR